MHPMTEMKEYLKGLSTHIRTLKFSRKGGDKNHKKLWDICYNLAGQKHTYRHTHIAYCLVRGRTYEQIENPAENNKPNLKLIESIQVDLQKKVDEVNEEWKLSRA
jgi:hypothetical protein